MVLVADVALELQSELDGNYVKMIIEGDDTTDKEKQEAQRDEIKTEMRSSEHTEMMFQNSCRMSVFVRKDRNRELVEHQTGKRQQPNICKPDQDFSEQHVQPQQCRVEDAEHPPPAYACFP